MTNLFGVPTMTFGNVSDVLLKSQQLTNQYNTKELPYYIPYTHHRDKHFLSL